MNSISIVVGVKVASMERAGERYGLLTARAPRLTNRFVASALRAFHMSESGVVAFGKSKRAIPSIFKSLPVSQAMVRVSRQIWPFKTDAELASRIGLSDRACRLILAERAKLSIEALSALLKTDDGYEFLEVLMGDAKPVWWRRFKRQVALAEVRRLQDAAQRRLEALEREEIE